MSPLVAFLLALSLSARPGFTPQIGRVEGLSVVIDRGPDGDETRRGDLLPVQATATSEPGQLQLRHTAPLSTSARNGFSAVCDWLESGGAGTLPDLTKALGLGGVVVSPDTEPMAIAGNSASLAMAVAASSVLLGTPVLQNVAFTGGVQPDGDVLPIGGAPDKLRGALRWRIDTFVAPLVNAEEAVSRLGMDDAGRIRVIGVKNVREALAEGFGPAGPWGEDWRIEQELLRRGVAALAEDHPAEAVPALNAYSGRVPRDLTAQAWLQTARAGGSVAPLYRAAALRATGRTADAVELLRRVSVDDRTARATAPFIISCLRDLAADARDGLLAECHEALARSDLPAAQARLTEAERTLQAEPDGADAIAWQKAEVTLYEARAATHKLPDDGATWRSLARAAEERREWREAADGYRQAREHGVATPTQGWREAVCLFRLRRFEDARALLQAQLVRWPGHDATRELLSYFGVDAVAPRPVLILPSVSPLSGLVTVQGGQDKDGGSTSLRLDGRELTAGPGRLAARWDTLAVTDGLHLLTAVARDAAGNLGQCWHPVQVRNAAAADTLVPATSGAVDRAEVHVIAAGTWLVARGQTVVIHPDRVYEPLLTATGRAAGDLRIALTPGATDSVAADHAIEVKPSGTSTTAELRLDGQFTDGRGVAPETIRLRFVETASGTLERSGVHLVVHPPAGFKPVVAAVVSGGTVGPWQDPRDLRVSANGPMAVVLVDANLNACQTAALAR